MKRLIWIFSILFVFGCVSQADASHRRKHHKPIGVSWNESTDTYARLGAVAHIATGAKLDDHLMARLQAAMQRCVLEDDGDVAYYLCPTDSTDRADCSTAANLDGTDGQVMVEINEIHLVYWYADSTHHWIISPEQFNVGGRGSSSLHGAFEKDGAIVQKRYIGAYEGSMYDDSASAMVASEDIATDMYAAGDKLCSISGQYPKVNEKRFEYRAMASERGAGWRQQDYYISSAVQLLYLVEYADFNSQTMIGMGRTQLSGGTWEAGSYIGIGGLSNSSGNATSVVNYSGDADDAEADGVYVCYRGIENLWGNVWKFIDSINIHNYDDNAGTAYSRAYVSNNETQYADDTSTNYTSAGDMMEADGYPGTLVQTSTGFLAAGAGGSSSEHLTDYYDTYFNALAAPFNYWRVVLLGGRAYIGSLAGAFCVATFAASSINDASICGRLCY